MSRKVPVPVKVVGKRAFVPTLELVAVAFGRSVRTINRWLADGAPPRETHGYCLGDWFAWRCDRAEVPEVIPPVESEALERLRIASAKLNELKFEKLSRELVPLAPLHRLLKDAVARMGRASGPLRDKYGPDAALIVDEAIERANALLDQMLAAPGGVFPES